MKKRMIRTIAINLAILLMIFIATTENKEIRQENHIETEPEVACVTITPILVSQEIERVPVKVDIVTAPAPKEVEKKKETKAKPKEKEKPKKTEEKQVDDEAVKEEKQEQKPEPWTSEEIELANLVEAEAGNQGMLGKQLVADVVLNRVDSSQFPDTIHDVIFQGGQFSVIGDGQFARMSSRITEESLIAARTEITGPRVDRWVLYFNSGSSCANGSGGWKYKDHWFAY